MAGENNEQLIADIVGFLLEEEPASRRLVVNRDDLLRRTATASDSIDKLFNKAKAATGRINGALGTAGDKLEGAALVAEQLFGAYTNGVHTLSTIIVKRDVELAKSAFNGVAKQVFDVLPDDMQGDAIQCKADYDTAGAGGRNAALAGIAAGAVAFTAAAFLAPGVLMAFAPVAAMALAGAYMKASEDRLVNGTLEENARVPLKDSVIKGARTGVTAGSAVFLGGIVFALSLPAGALALVGAGLGAGMGAALGYAGSEMGLDAGRKTLRRMENSPMLGMDCMSRLIRKGLNLRLAFTPQ